jgi:hypothetical protein
MEVETIALRQRHTPFSVTTLDSEELISSFSTPEAAQANSDISRQPASAYGGMDTGWAEGGGAGVCQAQVIGESQS